MGTEQNPFLEEALETGRASHKGRERAAGAIGASALLMGIGLAITTIATGGAALAVLGGVAGIAGGYYQGSRVGAQEQAFNNEMVPIRAVPNKVGVDKAFSRLTALYESSPDREVSPPKRSNIQGHVVATFQIHPTSTPPRGAAGNAVER